MANWLDNKYPGTGLSAKWSSKGHSPMVIGGHYYDIEDKWLTFKRVVSRRLEWLSQIPTKTSHLPGDGSETTGDQSIPSGRVFVVHGRDAGAKNEVARFLSKLKLEPVILHEKPNQGRTIIEKFERFSDVSFAVVLLTPDDVGRPAGQSEKFDKSRARQNVILELGHFLGKLGR